jgi:hypothetical protein
MIGYNKIGSWEKTLMNDHCENMINIEKKNKFDEKIKKIE